MIIFLRRICVNGIFSYESKIEGRGIGNGRVAATNTTDFSLLLASIEDRALKLSSRDMQHVVYIHCLARASHSSLGGSS